MKCGGVGVNHLRAVGVFGDGDVLKGSFPAHSELPLVIAMKVPRQWAVSVREEHLGSQRLLQQW